MTSSLPIDRLLPAAILRRVADRPDFLPNVRRYLAYSDDDLFQATKTCLHNLERLERNTGPDADLQVVLVPELWDRLRPGTRGTLRKITTTLAEYDPEKASRVTARLLSPEGRQRLAAEAADLRARIIDAATLDADALVERVRFAIAGSRAGDLHSPADWVYGPGFVYRLVPAIAHRVLSRRPRRPEES